MVRSDSAATPWEIVLHERQRLKRLADALPRERKAKSKVLTRFKLAARATMLCVASSALLAALSPVALANTVLDFDGTNDHLLSIGAGGSLFEIRNRDYTIEWMVRTTVGGNLVTNRYNPGGEGDRYIVGISFDTGLVSSYVNMGGGDAGADAAGLSSTTVVTDGEWHHIAWVRSSMFTFTLYIDGVAEGTATTVGTRGSFESNNEASFGAGYYPTPARLSNFSGFFDGQMDELRIWGDARTSAEINAFKDKELEGDEEDLLLYFDFEEGVANGDNTSRTTVTSKVSGAAAADLEYFSRTGDSSNYVTSSTLTFSENPEISIKSRRKTVSSPAFSMAATSTSSGAITYSSSDESVATIDSSGDVTILAAGTTTITANQAAVTGYNSATATATLLVKASNAAPTATGLPSSFTLTEDTAGDIDLSGVSFADSDGDPLVLDLAISAGSFGTPVAGTGLTITRVSATQLTLEGSVSNLNSYLGTASRIQYTGVANASGDAAATLVIKANDDTVEPTLGTLDIDITGVNDAPTLDATASPDLGTLARNAGDDDGSAAEPDDDAANNSNNSGVSVAELIVDGSVGDVDGAAIEAMAVIAVDNSNGVWQYSLDNGGSWASFSSTLGSSVTLSSAARLLDGSLSGGSTHRLRFVPSLNYSGSATLTFRAWDKSAGSAGATADASISGGSSAFSSTSDTAVVSVSGGDSLVGLRNAPAAQTFTEDTAGNIDLSALEVDEPDGRTISLTLSLSAGSFGTLGTGTGITTSVVSSNEVVLAGTASALTSHLDSASAVPFVPASNGFGAPYAVLSLSASDGVGAAATASTNLNVTGVNDAPTGSNVPFKGDSFLASAGDDDGDGADGDDDATDNANNQGVTVAALLEFAEASDVDGGGLGIAIFSVDNRSTGSGYWEYSTDNGASWTALPSSRGETDFVSTSVLLDGVATGSETSRVRFNPQNAALADPSFVFRIWDKSVGTAGGTADTATTGGSSAFSTVRPRFSLDALAAGSPLVANLYNDKALYYAGQPSTFMDVGRDAVFSDDTTSYDTAALQFQLFTGYEATEDVLSFSSDLGVSLAGTDAGSNVLIDDRVVGTLAFALPTNFFKVTLNSTAVEADVTTLIRSVIYSNTDTESPSTADRTLITTISGPTGNLRTFSRIVFGTANADGTLTAATGVSEPSAIPTTADTVGEAVDIMDFTLRDGGGGDGIAMNVSQIKVNVSGTSSDAQRGRLTWRLNGPDASNVVGSYSADADTLTFSGLSIAVADGGNETYTLNAFYNDNTEVVDNATVILTIDGDSDVTTSGTGMGATTAVSNGTGSTTTVAATQLVFSRQPAGSVSGAVLTTQPIVQARDAAGNVDLDFSETLSLSSSGALSGDVDVAAIAGVATFSGLVYTATTDKESFTLSVDDDAALASDLAPVSSSSISSEVTATRLAFVQQPSPTTIIIAEPTVLAPTLAVAGVDASGVIDTDYSGTIVISAVGDTGRALFSFSADVDTDDSTVTLASSAGAARFAGLSLSYSVFGAESFRLSATDGSFPAVRSVALTAIEPPPPPDTTIREKVDRTGKTSTDPEIDEGGELTGGEVCGDAKSEGKITDVTLCKGATITGGEVGGEITGDPDDPGTLSGVTVLPGSRLSNVNVGADVILLSGVVIADNVTFDSLINVPSGVAISSSFETVELPSRPGLQVLDLRSEVMPGAASAPRTSYLDIMQTTPEFQEPGAQLQQRAEGEVVMEFEDSEASLVPVRAYKTDAPAAGQEGFGFDEDGYLSVRTNANIEIIMYPMFTSSDAIEEAIELEDPAYQISYGSDAEFVITQDRKTGAEATLPRYLGRPGLSASKIKTRPLERPLGLYFYDSPWLKNVEAVSLITRAENGELREQELVPTPANWLMFKARILREPRITGVSIDPRGVISIKEIARPTIRVVAAYEVTPNAVIASDNRALLFINAGDLNGDGEDDYYSYYPNGDRQLLYVVPQTQALE